MDDEEVGRDAGQRGVVVWRGKQINVEGDAVLAVCSPNYHPQTVQPFLLCTHDDLNAHDNEQ